MFNNFTFLDGIMTYICPLLFCYNIIVEKNDNFMITNHNKVACYCRWKKNCLVSYNIIYWSHFSGFTEINCNKNILCIPNLLVCNEIFIIQSCLLLILKFTFFDNVEILIYDILFVIHLDVICMKINYLKNKLKTLSIKHVFRIYIFYLNQLDFVVHI